ncbi:SDR family NAD(P)-dependent oxidoreductase [Saccharomonospora azurea]|uniref:Polyketide synthase family protein n=1 Tax=Saccharomonospora azurea NA-128 TaxID=882081 RepID=H8GC79_9PSEU|nr:SDR family NAD(P)-dependent oxidoreductase [Saccharomonospora azurea]EHY87756.1 polyketide synthase family protein [Saccharomonospora azurea NA-128]
MSAQRESADVRSTDIAVVGMSGRFPGAANIEQFWELLRSGRDGITRFTEEDLRSAGIPVELIDDPDYVRAHGVLGGVDLFDTALFEYTPADAEYIDPQQRLFLEQAYAALEDAGYDSARYPGLIGVYAGAAINLYLQRHVLPHVDQTTTAQHFAVMVGNDKDYLSTRVSYKLDLRGPSYTVQTACSTSLVAIHLACQALVNGECDLALAGGVTVKVPEETGYLYDEGAILSADGRVRTFDTEASGTVLGNGVGVVVLKPCRDALADGDTIHAVIKGTATNNDGSMKVGYAAPGKEGQVAVIADAQAVAGVDPSSIGHVEAHGTATRLGDPVEVSALTEAFRRKTDRSGFCAIGSVKSNVGHLDAAAGVAGVIKSALMLRERTIVPTVNFERPNPAIDFASSPFYVATDTADWERPEEGPRRAAVSSFGIGGTNAHAILEEAPPRPVPTASARREQPLVLSAKTPSALQAMRRNLAEHLERRPELALADVAYTLAVGRRELPYRYAVVAGDVETVVADLRSDSSPDSVRRTARVSFVFGDDLPDAEALAGALESEPEFAQRYADCLAAGAAELGEPGRIFAAQYALGRCWRRWGITPSSMHGDALGRWVAAAVAGDVELADALAVVSGQSDGAELPQGPIPIASVSAVAEEAGSVVLRAGAEGPAQTVARLWRSGVAIDWTRYYSGERRGRVPLPTYPFEGRRCWMPAAAPVVTTTTQDGPHPLLGTNVSTMRGSAFELALSGDEFVVADHVVFGDRVFPAAGYVELARAAGEVAGETRVGALRSVSFDRLVPVGARGETLRIDLLPRDAGALDFTIRSRDGGCARGELVLGGSEPEPPVDLDGIRARCTTERAGAECYRAFERHGLRYGPNFRVLREVRLGEREAVASLALTGDDERLPLHPCLLDGAFQTVVALLSEDAGASEADTPSFLPLGFGELRILAPLPSECHAVVRLRDSGGRKTATADLTVTDDDGTVVAQVRALVVRRLAEDTEHTATTEALGDDARADEPHGEGELVRQAEEVLRGILAETTKLDPADLDPAEPFERYGIDSLMISRLNERMEAHFGELSKTLFFEYESLGLLAEYFAEEHPERIRQLAASSGGDTAPGRRAEPVLTTQTGADADPLSARSDDHDDAIAIIGLSGRYPMADDVHEFWENLAQGRDCITEVPADRWDHDRFFDPERQRLGSAHSRWGGFLSDVDKFDPLFFPIMPREADLMDPQERLFLETAWHVVEDAGYRRDDLRGRPVGVFVGVMYGEYQFYGAVDALRGGRPVTNSSYASIANRVSYLLDLQGPSLALDTMCSSSLTALHLACESLRRGESELAIAGGVNVSVHPYKYVFLSQGGYVSSDGRCRAFGAGGDGYVPGEGVGAVLLKPRRQALADGDHIYGLVLGSAVNHGGKTNGYTVPNPHAQQRVITEAWRKAGVSATDIGYVEAHGTGTALGDPIEITGLTKALGGADVPSGSCAIGSVKSNVGHLESAAGIAGLTKVLMQFRHGMLAPSLHADEPNPNIDFSRTPFAVQRTLAPWPERRTDTGPAPRIAALSSFGAGGSNAHVVLAEHRETAPSTTVPAAQRRDTRSHAFVLSARAPERLRDYARRLAEHLEREPLEPADVAYTLQVGRVELEHRLAVVTADGAELVSALRACAEEEPAPPHAVQASAATDSRSRARYADEVGAALESDDLLALARLWTRGAAVDWTARHAGDDVLRRVSLPGYPFARHRHWVDSATTGPVAVSGTPGLHPLLDRNDSTLRRQTFTTELTDSLVVADHRVSGKRVLPAAACLEMARAAGELAAEAPVRAVRAIRFERMLGPDDGHRSVTLSLAPESDGTVSFDIGAEDVVGVRGRIELGHAEQPGPVDVTDLHAACSRPGDVEAAYALFERRGLTYGEPFRSVRGIRHGDGEVLATLRLHEGLRAEAGRYTLHPCLLDGAFQAAGLLFDTEERYLPVAVDEVSAYAPFPADCLAHARLVRRDGDGLVVDVTVLATDGTVLARVHGLGFRAVPTAERPRRLLLRPVWEPAPIEESVPPEGAYLLLARTKDERARLCEALRDAGRAEAVVVLAEPGAEFARQAEHHFVLNTGHEDDVARLLSELADDGVDVRAVVHALARPDGTGSEFDDGVGSLLPLCKALLARRGSSELRMVYLCPAGSPAHEAVAGFARSARLENPRLLCHVVSGATDAASFRDAVRELGVDATRPEQVRYDGHCRRVRGYRPMEPESGPLTTVPLRDGGVYVITGGAGGVGLLLAEHITRQVTSTIVLTGRSEPSDAVSARMAALETRGSTVRHARVDVTDEDAVRRLVADLREEHGGVHGVVHAAGVLRDGFLFRKSRADLAAVLAPKVTGARVLDRATAREDLDFFVLCSSVAAVFGNVGQTDYAYANAFLDHYASLRQELVEEGLRSGRTVSIAWPHWQNGGMALSEQDAQALRRRTGLTSMSTAECLAAFDDALRSSQSCVVVATGDRDRIVEQLAPGGEVRPKAIAVAPEPMSDTTARRRVLDLLRDTVGEKVGVNPADVETTVPLLTRYGIDSVVVTELTNALGDHFPDLAATAFFEYETLEALADHLADEYPAEVAALDGGPSSDAAPQVTAAPAGRFLTAEPAFEAHWAQDGADDPIAVIGMSGRYPMADDLGQFWDNLRAGRDCVSEVPPERWDHHRYTTRSGPGAARSRWGGFMSDVDKFDPLFFSISPREAELMDPQERLFLETSWHVLEDAGYRAGAVRGKHVGVFVGVMYGEYQLYGAADAVRGGHPVTESSFAFIANRVSYALDLHGPSLALDTMCSSSLTALHLACQSLRLGESELAIAGGVNLSLHPYKYVLLSQSNFLSSDGRCRAFGAGGDGYVPGEGVGAVLLKPLSRAVADGDHVYGVILGSAVNHGGATNGSGLTVPNPRAQQELVVRALAEAGTDPRELSYVEAHGTGTSLGDPIELAALTKAFRQHTSDERFCAIGSVKSNIGHLESAAGVAGLTKLLLQLRHGTLVPSLHTEQLNPDLGLDRSPFVVQRDLADWPRSRDGDGQPIARKAGISSFGAGGANAHVIVSEHLDARPVPTAPAGEQRLTSPVPFVLSARDEDRLREYAGRLADFLRRHEVPLADVAYTLAVGREPMRARLAVVTADGTELVTLLRRFADGANPSGLARADVGRDAPRQGTVEDSTDPQTVAQAWLAGAEGRWQELRWSAQPPRRTSLPGYPFARRRYWVSSVDEPERPRAVEGPALHPLLDANISTVEHVRFRKTLSAADPLLRDHVVHGRPLLAGAAGLELIHAVARRASETPLARLSGITWARPITVEAEALDLRVEVRQVRDGLAVEIVSDAAGNREVHVRATAVYGEPSHQRTRLDLAAARARCSARVGRDEVYRAYRDAGFEYGPSFQVTDTVHSGPREAMVELALRGEDVPGYTLHPALLDGALRACHWIGDGPRAAADLVIPFELGALEVFAPIPRRCYAHAEVLDAGAQRSSWRYRVTIVDDDGVPFAVVDDLAGRPAGSLPRPPAVSMPVASTDPVCYVPDWRSAAPGPQGSRGDVLVIFSREPSSAARLGRLGGWPRTIVVCDRTAEAADTAAEAPGDIHVIDPVDVNAYRDLIAGLPATANVDVVHMWTTPHPEVGDLDEEIGRGAVSLLLLAQAVGASGRAGRTRCVSLHRDEDAADVPAHELIGGLASTAARHLPHLELCTVHVPSTAGVEWLADVLRGELSAVTSPRGLDVRYDGARRTVRTVRRLTGDPAAAAPPTDGGVYVLAGGRGGVGMQLARHLARTYHARLVLLGRSAPPEHACAELESLGAEVLAVRADLTDAHQTRAALVEARGRFGHLDGVFHLAGVADQQPLTDVSGERFRSALAAKVHGVVNLDRCTRADRLSFFVAFSSVSSLIGDFGSGSYAAANRFVDAYVRRRARWAADGLRHGRSVSVQWPLWEAGGMDSLVRSDELTAYRETTGLDRLSPEQAMRALDVVWRYDVPVLAPVHGDQELIARVLTGEESAVSEPERLTQHPSAPVAPSPVGTRTAELVDYLRNQASGVLKLDPAQIAGDAPLQEYGIDSVMITELTDAVSDAFPGLRGTVLFEYRTLADLAGYLLRERADDAARLLGEPAPPVAVTETARDVTTRPRPSTPTDDRPDVLSGTGDIAIIGMSGRYPGADTLDEFWENLRQGRDAVTEIPRDRWSLPGFYDPDPDSAGTSYGKWGGFLSDVDTFDSLFFAISPMQAKSMDPQERLFLQTAWAALEDAGYPLDALPRPRFSDEGRDVGVFVGVMWDDYAMLAAEESARNNHQVVMANRAAIANQVSYFGDFRGPSVVVDTACSASLVALHQACESVVRGECSYALAGGVNVSVHPLKYVHLSRKKMLAEDGRCRSFGAGGTGYVPGEGVGAVLLKRLDRAVADGDNIHAVIKATAVNHGGRTHGFTVPNPNAQRALIREALAKAGVSARDIGYVEAHGTGTSLGDPIEHTGLAEAFRSDTGDRGFCALGSVKSNIGHLEGAAGIAGVSKAVLQLRHGELVPSLHADEPNPVIDFAESPFRIQRELRSWPTEGGAPRRAAVSSFGAGGTNAHVVLEEFVRTEEPVPAGPELVVVSARDDDALRRYAAVLSDHLAGAGAGLALADVAHTLRVGREAMVERLAFVARDLDEAVDTLAAVARGQARPGVHRGNAKQGDPALADLFTTGEGGREFLRGLARAGQWDKLAALWVSGVVLDWADLPEAAGHRGRRVSLPTYPFARVRHWITRTGDTPSGEQGERTWRRTLRPDDPLVADHVVGGRTILPGAGYLDLVLDAVGDDQRALTDVYWMAPVVVDADAEDLVITVGAPTSGRRDFAVRGADAEAATVSCRGVLVDNAAAPTPPEVSLDAVLDRSTRQLDGEAFYDAMSRLGVTYGPYFRLLERVWFSGDVVVSRFRATEHGDVQRRALHPAVLDAALHTVAAYYVGDDLDGVPFVPYSAQRVLRFRALPAVGHVHVVRAGRDAYDVTVLDDSGRVCVRVDGLAVRRQRTSRQEFSHRVHWTAAPRPPAPAAPPGSVLIVTFESATGLAEALTGAHGDDPVRCVGIGPDGPSDGELDRILAGEAGPDTVYFLGEGATAEADAVAPERGVLALSQLVKALHRHGRLDGRTRVKVVTTDAVALTADDPVRPANAALHGFCSVLRSEHPVLPVSCVDVRTGEEAESAPAVVAEPWTESGEPVLLRSAVRYVRALVPVALPEPAASPFRREGCYVVVGGLGVVGFDTCTHLARTYGARLVVVGRSALDSARRDRIAQLERAGGAVLYVRGDAADPAVLREALRRGEQRFGAVHGVIHSVMEFDAEPIVTRSASRLRADVESKARTVAALFEVVRTADLDFVLVHSSAASFRADAGQSGYAAGCGAADAVALGVAASGRVPVTVVNWGYWHAAGRPEREQVLRQLAGAGVEPITAAAGMSVVERALACPLPQVVAIRAHRRALAAIGVRDRLRLRSRTGGSSSLVHAVGDAVATGDADTARIEAHQRASAEAERLARRLLLGAFQSMGVFRTEGERHRVTGLRDRLGFLPRYHRLCETAVDILVQAGYLDRRDDEVVVTARVAEQGVATVPDSAVRDLVAEYPDIAAVATLLVRCVAAFPDVVTGKRSHMDVLFPEGSMDLVVGVYQGNAITDSYNQLVAGAVADYVERRLRDEPGARLRILEVGAGTGSTSAPVLAALAPHAGSVTYTYTDITSAFVRHGRKQFAARYPFVRFATLDIDADLAEQGFDVGDYDVVLGTNVFHVTPSVAHTMRQVKRLLKPGGMVAANEGTAFACYLPLIFGLTDGWWRYEDTHYRIPGSPLITVPRWRDLLATEGFRDVVVRTLPPTRVGTVPQSLLLAESDGVVALAGPGEPTDETREADRVEQAGETVPPLASDRRTRESRPQEPDLREVALTQVIAVFARVLEMSETQFEPDEPFEVYGIDSLVVPELKQALEIHFGPLPAPVLFEHTTIGRLADYLCAEHADTLLRSAPSAPVDPALPAEPEPGEPEPAAVAETGLEQAVARLSDEQVAHLLGRLGALTGDNGHGRNA